MKDLPSARALLMLAAYMSDGRFLTGPSENFTGGAESKGLLSA